MRRLSFLSLGRSKDPSPDESPSPAERDAPGTVDAATALADAREELATAATAPLPQPATAEQLQAFLAAELAPVFDRLSLQGGMATAAGASNA